jgi:hypothetical protein
MVSAILYLNHPKPIVEQVLFEELEPSLIVGDPFANQEVFEDTIQFRAKAIYNDSLSNNEKVYAQAFCLYNGIETPYNTAFELTQTGENELIVPAYELPKIQIPLYSYSGYYKIYLKSWFNIPGIETDTIISDTIFLIHLVTDINQTSVNFDVNLFPTVSYGKFYLQIRPPSLQKINFKIYDQTGNCVIENYDLSVGSSNVLIDLTGKPKGVYIINLQMGGSYFSKKMIIN